MDTATRARELIKLSFQYRAREQYALAIAEARRALGYAQTLENDADTHARAELELGAALVADDDGSDAQWEEGMTLLSTAAERFRDLGSIERYAALVEIGDLLRRTGNLDDAEKALGMVYQQLEEPRWQSEALLPRAMHLRGEAAVRIGLWVLDKHDDPSEAMRWWLAGASLFLAGDVGERPWVERVIEVIEQEIANAPEVVSDLRRLADERWGAR